MKLRFINGPYANWETNMHKKTFQKHQKEFQKGKIVEFNLDNGGIARYLIESISKTVMVLRYLAK